MRLSKPNFPFKILILFFITIVLNGCSETTFLVNSAKRIGSWGDDPVYKIGNPYKIYGKWYYPAVDYNYKEIGIASWYGPGFHGKKLLMEKFLIKIKFLQLIEHFQCHR